MAKKAKKRQLDMIINFVVTLLGLAAIVMMFLPNVGINDSDKTFTGLQIAFGYNRKVGNSEVAVFNFSFMNLLTFILAAVGVVSKQFSMSVVWPGISLVSIAVILLMFLLVSLAAPYFICRASTPKQLLGQY